MHIVRFTFKLNLLVILVNTYILFFVLRAFVPLTKQLLFNRIYRFVFKTTEPVLRLFGKIRKNGLDYRALYVSIGAIVLYSILWPLDNKDKFFMGGFIYMLASFVTYFFYLFSFIFISEFFILRRGVYAYGEFARVIHFLSDSVIGWVRKLFPKLVGKIWDYTPGVGLLFTVVLSALFMTILSGFLGDAVSLMENIGMGLLALVDMFAFVWILLLLVRLFLFWIPVHKENFLYENIMFLTEPVLAPIKSYLPMYKVGVDFSVIIAIVLIFLVRWFVFIVIKFIF